MTSLEYADEILREYRNGKKAASVADRGQLECLIICADGSVVPVSGYLAFQLSKRLKAEMAEEIK